MARLNVLSTAAMLRADGPSPRSARCVPDMEYSHASIEHTIKHFEGITNERDDMQTGPLAALWRAERISRDALNHGANARFQRFGYQITEHLVAVGSNL